MTTVPLTNWSQDHREELFHSVVGGGLQTDTFFRPPKNRSVPVYLPLIVKVLSRGQR